MPDNGKPATGPLIMEQLLLLREEVAAIREAQERRDRQLAGLSAQVDRFLAAEIDITSTLVQVREAVNVNRAAQTDLKRAAQDLSRTITTALDLAVGDPSLKQREQNGH